MKVKQEHVDASATKKIPIKTINSKVFDSFNQLTNDGKVQRINGAVGLLQHLSKNQHDIENKVRSVKCLCANINKTLLHASLIVSCY